MHSDEIKLHLGCGEHPLEGWINIDRKGLTGVDRVLDVRNGLPYENVRYIFAEHFIEHLELKEALSLLAECRRILIKEGILRLSTPNLDWVWVSGYPSRWTQNSESTAIIDPSTWENGPEVAGDCLNLNLAFRGWGHRFLYNRAMLTEVLLSAGFGNIEFCEYGFSRYPDLKGLEKHEKEPDAGGIPSVLIVEASGFSDHATDESLFQKLRQYLADSRIT